MYRCVVLLFLIGAVRAWPDGAPCLRNNIQSMIPDADEHKGGENNSPPPFEIVVSRRCYNSRQAISVSLNSKDNVTLLRGFALQARILGTDMHAGEFKRDDNGSWKYQCFGNHAAITHSHPTKKTRIPTWWEYSEVERGEYVQFLATVVESRLNYWPRNIRSIVLPPCRLENEYDVDPMSIEYPAPKISKLPAFKRYEDKDFFGASSDTDFEPDPTTTKAPTKADKQKESQQKPTPPPIECSDQDGEDQCKGWINLCGNDNYVDKHCRKTCGSCSDTCANAEVDNLCTGWEIYCKTSSHVQNYCMKTCNLC